MKTKQPQDYLGRSMSGPTDFYLRREQLQKARTGGKQSLTDKRRSLLLIARGLNAGRREVRCNDERWIVRL